MRNGIFLNTYSVVEIGNKYYFWETCYNALFCYSIDTGTTELLYRENGSGTRYSTCVKDGEYLVLIPFGSDKVCLFNYITRALVFVEIGAAAMFSGAFKYGRCIVMWGWTKGKVKKLDLERLVIEEVDCMKDVNVVSNGCRVNNTIYGYDGDKNDLYAYDMDKELIQYFDCDDLRMKVSTLIFLEGSLWLFGNEKMAVKYDVLSRTSTSFELDAVTVNNNNLDALFRDACVVGSKVFLSPYKAGALVSIDYKNNDICKEIEIGEDEIGGVFVDIAGEKMWVVERTNEGNASCQYHLLEDGLEKKNMLFLADGKDLIKSNEITLESSIFPLTDFIDVVTEV
ncbi:hypothetical protein [Butyrivibrio sp. TB]|uniref:hypothetical protein n=1 Tax=Butyrivibrio sp. TB TaxID=1520809 RepID=UPI0008ADC8E1|nr:hypothetical protein [Butyrivibrio sp. TB]SEQ15305.1 hypothetical protein SAMN02910382_02181 [Butyrivibrio sp. TB]